MRQIVQGFLGDKRVDLYWQAKIRGSFDRTNGPVKAAFDAAHGFMAGCIGPVKAQAEAFDTMRFQLCEHFICQCWSRAGSDRNGQSQFAGFVDEVVDVGSIQRISAGQNQMGQRFVKGCNLAQKGLAFVVR